MSFFSNFRVSLFNTFAATNYKNRKEMKKIFYWVEIPAVDFDRAVDFYSKLLNVELEKLDWGEEKMACLPDDAGAISYSPDFNPSKDGVLVSMNAGTDLDGWIEKIVANGGSIIRPKTKIEAEGRGSFALFLDTEGNRLGLYGE
jgi:hypothetical protein